MKKLSALLMAVMLLITLCACGQQAEPANDSIKDPVPEDAGKLAETFITAYYLRDYATQFSLCLYDARGQWEAAAIKDAGSEKDFFKLVVEQAAAKGEEVVVDSFDSYYAAYHRFYVNNVKENFGEYTLNTEITQSVKMTEDLLPQFRENLLVGPSKEYMDEAVLNAIDTVYTISVHLTVEGELKDFSETYLVYAVFYNNQWFVADYAA